MFGKYSQKYALKPLHPHMAMCYDKSAIIG
jgi:hypothetical protein